jgi:hypothetical protein
MNEQMMCPNANFYSSLPASRFPNELMLFAENRGIFPQAFSVNK